MLKHPDKTSLYATMKTTLEAILDQQNVLSAWHRVRRNQGCPGVDGVGIQELKPQFSQHWNLLERTIRSGTYQPRPVKRVRIQKPTGGERRLGIPTVLDRVVQQAIAQVLSRIWEPCFSSRSFAYRAGRGPHHALVACERAVNCGGAWTLHLDIADFFDSVPHAVALAILKDIPIEDKATDLIERSLASGVYEDGLVRTSSIGLAQGSPLSPLLANIVLNRMDQCLEATGHEFARYADDCLLLLPQMELVGSVRSSVVEVLRPLGLRLNDNKTASGHFTTARFLGFAFCQGPQGRVVRAVSPEAFTEAETAFMKLMQLADHASPELAGELARKLRSWLAYFYTPGEESRLRAMVEGIRSAWRKQFAVPAVPECLCWETLRGGDRGDNHIDYSGYFRTDPPPAESADWPASFQCWLERIVRSRWWHVEYNLGFGGRPGARLYLGRHRINLRL